jgi:mono/diheme cytochrome c family protein
MRRKIALLALMTEAVLAPLAARAANIQLESVKVDLPQSDRLFTGQGADAINNNCLACHSADMVLNQPVLAKTAWQAEVNKMIQIYKAPIAATDAAAVVDYLARTKGPGN